MNQIKKEWKKLLRIGLPSDASFKEQLRTELCNQFVFIGLLISVFHVFITIVSHRSIPDMLVGTVWVLLLFLTLLFTLNGKTKQAQIFLVSFGTFCVFVLHVLMGPEIKLESMYILFTVTAAAFFDYKKVLQSCALILISYFLATIICNMYGSPYSDYVSPTGPYSRFIFSTIMIVLLITKLIMENMEYNKIMNIQNEHLVDSNEKLKSFNYIVSHDLKEPIRSIVSFSQLVDNQAKNKKPISPDYLKYIIQSGKQLNHLLEDLETFRDSSEKLLTTEIFTIKEIIDETKFSLKDLIENRNAVITHNKFIPIQTSKMAISIILKNLIENGIKYNNSDIPKIKITTAIENNNLSIEVEDNGIGIKKENYNAIFTLFNRLNSDSSIGSGLGLNIVRNLIKRMNGSIEITNSDFLQGTSFCVFLPLQNINEKYNHNQF